MEINWRRNTALFVAGQTLSLFGTLLVQYAILWHITLKTQSGTMMTVFTIAGFLPMFFISPFAGVWADRFNRKKYYQYSGRINRIGQFNCGRFFTFRIR